MRRPSFLLPEDKENLEIKKFIFHVILKEQDEPEYLDGVEVTPEQLTFFKDRLVDASKGHEFVFREDNSDAKEWCSQIIGNPNTNFITCSKQLAGHFKKCHTNNATNGAFIIALVSTNNKDFIFLLKTDNKKVYPYSIENHVAILEEIRQSFVEDKEAIQKGAIISLSDEYAWDVVAFDNQKTSGKIIGDYYRKFLDVDDMKNSEVLTKAVIHNVRQWHSNNKANLDLGEDFSIFKQKTLDYLENTEEYKEEEFITALTVEILADSVQKQAIKDSIQDSLENEGLGGLNFKPLVTVIDKRRRKTQLKTSEDVIISWIGEAEKNNIYIPNQKADDGYYHIVVKTETINYNN